MSDWHLQILAETRRQLLSDTKPRNSPITEPLVTALDKAGKKYRHFNQSHTEIREYIHDRLRQHWTLETWLFRNHNVPISSMFSANGKMRMLATRLAWIDHLEKVFRSKT